MSQISTIYDAMVTRLDSLFPSGSGWVRLPNPYKPEENNEQYLKQGWGIVIGAGEQSNRIQSCQYSVDRSMQIVFTRKFYALENSPTNKATTEKQLLEDLYTLINDFEQDATLGAPAMFVAYVSDPGLEYVSNEKDNFLMIRPEFRVGYIENFT